MSKVRPLKTRLLRVIGWKPGIEPEGKKSWGGYRREIIRAFPVICITIMLVSWAEAAGWFRGFEMSHLDTMIRLRSREPSKNIVVVEISEADYLKEFHGTSPLDKSELLRLILAVQNYNPSVIGVDIDTNDWGAACGSGQTSAAKCAEIDKKLNELRENEKTLPGTAKKRSAIVWAAVPRTLEPPLQLKAGPGGLPLGTDHEGIPRFPVDSDGSVRHFDSQVEIAKVNGGCPKPAELQREKCYLLTFAEAILTQYPGFTAKPSDERVIFNFYGDRYRFPIIEARQLLPDDSKPDTRTTREKVNATLEIEDSRAALLAGKIVLIGGSFQEARDAYFTPLGPMQGVELNALAIQTDLSGGGIRDFNEVCEYLLDWVVSILIVGVFYRYGTRPWKALKISTLAILAALISSLIAFNTVAYWFNFIPIAAGVVVDQILHLAEGGAEAKRELDKLKRERQQVEVDAASVEGLTDRAAGPVDCASNVEDLKVKRAASAAH